MKSNERLRAIRKSLGYTQVDFAKILGLTQGGYSDIERGRNEISNPIKKLLVEIHHINLTYLENGTGKMFITKTPCEEKILSSENLSNKTNDELIQFIEKQTFELLRFYEKLVEAKDIVIESLEKRLK